MTRDALLPSHGRGVRMRFERIFAERGIAVVADNAVIRVEPGSLMCADGRRIGFDEALWVTAAGAAPWLAETGLPLDAGGLCRDRRVPALSRRCRGSLPPATSRR